MTELVKGANARLTGPSIRASVRTSLGPGQVDVCAVLVNAQRQVRGDADFVFFNHKQSGCGSTRLVSPVELQVDLHRLPPDVDAVVIAAALDDELPGSVESNGGGGFVVRDGSNTFGHTFDGLSTERCVIAAEIYRRHDGWKVRAVSQGYDDLVGLVTAYGIQTEEEAPAPADSRLPSARGSTHTDEPRAELDRPEPAGNRSAPSSTLPPAETREVIDRVRIGAAARRAAAVPGRRRATVFPSARRGNVTATQYKAHRRAEAEHLTAEVQHQIRQLETVLTQLPYPDLSPATLDDLLDASAPNNARNRWALFRRRAQNPPPIPPSQTLGRVVRQLRELAAAEAHQDAIEAWLWLGLFATDLQPSFGHVERIGVQAQQRRVVLDIAVPDRALVPGHSRVRYKAVVDRHELVPLPDRDHARLVETLISAGVLAHAHAAATVLGAAQLPADWLIVINAWEWNRDPATGRQKHSCRSTIATSPQELTAVHLTEVDPPRCIRALGGKTSTTDHVTPRATAVRSGHQGRQVDLVDIDPYEFERLIAELAEAVGYTAYLTPRSGDHGVDVFVESTDTLANGRIVISAKRFNSTVGPDHVRALDSVVRDQGAIKGILITTSRFGPESFRLAEGKPIELVDGEKLRAWLGEYLHID